MVLLAEKDIIEGGNDDVDSVLVVEEYISEVDDGSFTNEGKDDNDDDDV